ncbi:MAG: hypothetical protein EBR30_30640, partial [Cytophagia bacterium]|nr:hypothetical protein [Cytophagia bacterium]
LAAANKIKAVKLHAINNLLLINLSIKIGNRSALTTVLYNVKVSISYSKKLSNSFSGHVNVIFF